MKPPVSTRLLVGAAVAVVIAIAAAGALRLRGSPTFDIIPLSGQLLIGPTPLKGPTRVDAPATLTATAGGRARVRASGSDELIVEPETRLTFERDRGGAGRIALERGRLGVTLGEPAPGVIIDAGSTSLTGSNTGFTVQLDDTGTGRLRVMNGWVRGEGAGRTSLVPAGAGCVLRRGQGPGVPVFEDASAAFQDAVVAIETHAGSSLTRRVAVDVVAAEARARDALTLWHLLARLERPTNTAVYDRLARLAPPPAGVTREGAVGGDQTMLSTWREALRTQ